MECAVCYGEIGPFQKLCCGHTFCTGCVKNWYLKGAAGSSCPMCRAPIYFKGFRAVRDQWNEEAYETRCAEILSEVIDESIAEANEMAEDFPDYRDEILEDTMQDLVEIEKTFRFLRNEGLSTEDIDYVLRYTTDYYSDRHLDKCWYNDEPIKDPAPKLANRGAGRCGKRARARQDPWATFTLIIDF